MSCFYIRKTKKIIRRNLIVMAKLQKMADRKLVSTTFVTGIHGLGSSENVGNFLLGFVMIFA